MKTKAYKLAAELGLQEQPVLDWLRANGYPNARRADMIRADVAQAARKALGRQGRGRIQSARPPVSNRQNRRHDTFANELARPTPMERARDNRDTVISAPAVAEHAPREPLTATFAELLEGHVDSAPGDRIGDTVDFVGGHGGAEIDQTTQDLHLSEVGRALSDAAQSRLEDELKIERARVEGLERMLDSQRAEIAENTQLKTDLVALREHNRALLEKSKQKQDLLTIADERDTLEATCAELRNELSDAREMLSEIDDVQNEHDSIMGDLETARQREVAWRTRALELERAAHAGDDFGALHEKHGLTSEQSQVRVLQALLSVERTAQALLKSVRQIDADFLTRILERQLRPTCSNPVCRQVIEAEQRIPLRIDSDKDCVVCRGSRERRWFSQMNSECKRAGIRRILIVGGSDTTHRGLRGVE